MRIPSALTVILSGAFPRENPIFKYFYRQKIKDETLTASDCEASGWRLRVRWDTQVKKPPLRMTELSEIARRHTSRNNGFIGLKEWKKGNLPVIRSPALLFNAHHWSLYLQNSKIWSTINLLTKQKIFLNFDHQILIGDFLVILFMILPNSHRGA